MKFPDDSIQSLVASSSWWRQTDSRSVDRGFLIKAFIPHVDQTPNTIEPVGRQEANMHSKAIVKIRPLDIQAPRKREDLPVAAMTYIKMKFGLYTEQSSGLALCWGKPTTWCPKKSSVVNLNGILPRHFWLHHIMGLTGTVPGPDIIQSSLRESDTFDTPNSERVVVEV